MHVEIDNKKPSLFKAQISKIFDNETFEELKTSDTGNMLFFENLAENDISRGDLIFQQKTHKIAKFVDISLDIFEQDEGGRKFPIKPNFQSTVFL